MLHSLAVQGKKTDIDILIRSNNNETKIMQHFRITKGPPRRMGGGGGGTSSASSEEHIPKKYQPGFIFQ